MFVYLIKRRKDIIGIEDVWKILIIKLIKIITFYIDGIRRSIGK